MGHGHLLEFRPQWVRFFFLFRIQISAETSRMLMQCLFKFSQLQEKNSVLPIEKFQVFLQARNAIMLQHLIIHFFALLSVKWLLTED